MKNVGKGLEKQIGIYKISCSGNNHCYIGSSINIKERWQKHLAMLRCGKHDSSYLQHSYNKYGEDSLTFEVVEILPNATEKELRETEWYYIDLYKPQFNSAAPIVYNRTDEWKSKISETTKRLYIDNGYVNPRKGVGQKYKMFTPDGNVLYHNMTLPEVCEVLGNKDYHSINNSLRKYNIAVSKDKRYLTVPEEQTIEDTIAYLHDYASSVHLGLRLVDSQGIEQQHGRLVTRRLKQEILSTNNNYTFYHNKLVTLSFMPLYVVTHIE